MKYVLLFCGGMVTCCGMFLAYLYLQPTISVIQPATVPSTESSSTPLTTVKTTSAPEQRTPTTTTATTTPTTIFTNTLTNPQTVTSADGKTNFVYGTPADWISTTSPRTIIISLPGHGTAAAEGYQAWAKHLDGTFALAEFDWWRGTGEKKTDYYLPPEIIREVRAFLHTQGYTPRDTIILHGFSRGSANTYAVIAQDHLIPGAVFDAVISNAGKYQSDFPLGNKTYSDTEITSFFKDIPWVLACGGLDPNPDRGGCPGMAETADFLTAHSANVLGTVTDPAVGHGAFHMSPNHLPAQALELILDSIHQ